MYNILFIFLLSVLSINSKVLETFYGRYNVEDEVIHELIEDKDFQRLKHVRQYGPRYHAIKPESYTRYDHSLGVMILLKRFGASIEEQVAGLLHDASHTVFSHVGDFLFERKNLNIAYQDEIHCEYLKASSLNNILNKHNVCAEKLACEKDNFKQLEQELPDVCADRLEYNLQGAYVHGIISKEEIEAILSDMGYQEGKWYFKSISIAKKFALLPLTLMVEVWSSPENMYIYELLSQVMMYAYKQNFITMQDISHGTDDKVWYKLHQIEDQIIQSKLYKIMNWKTYMVTSEKPKEGFKAYNPKFRGIDPLVKINNQFVRLTDLDEDFSEKYNNVRSLFNKGFHIAFD